MDPVARVKWVLARLNEVEPQTLAHASITVGKIKALILQLPHMLPSEREEVFLAFEQLVNADLRRRAGTDFLSFVRLVWPGFIEGAHLRKMAQVFQDIAEGRKRRLIVNMPPRHGKSEFTSYLFPAWFLGRFPSKKLMIATHTASLAQNFGRKIRNLIASDLYQEIFPGVELAEDSKAKGLWLTKQDGEFFAAGVGSGIAGRGADLLIMDDPYSERDALDGEYNPELWEKVWQWYLTGPRQRMQPGGAICLVHTRWSQLDMTEKLIKRADPKDKFPWTVIRFPALLPSGRQLWPEFWPLDEILALQDEIDPVYWAAQYQQDPTSDTVAIVKRSVWVPWKKSEMPEARFIITAVDTAHSKKKDSDFSALTSWAIFDHEVDGETVPCAIMIAAMRERLEYPELKMFLLGHHREYRPDMMKIEAKAAGMPLIQELGRMGLPVLSFVPTSATGDKVRRLREVTDLFKAGRIFYPDREWAREVIEEIASFPKGEHDDFVDTVSMALGFMKDGDFIRVDQLPQEEEEVDEWRVKEYY